MIPLNSFEVSLSPLAVRQDFLPEPVRLKEYDIFRKLPEEERYCCSCAALEGAELPDEMIQVDLRGLLEHFV